MIVLQALASYELVSERCTFPICPFPAVDARFRLALEAPNRFDDLRLAADDGDDAAASLPVSDDAGIRVSVVGDLAPAEFNPARTCLKKRIIFH